MNNPSSHTTALSFDLEAVLAAEVESAILLDIVAEMKVPSARRPLQCVTFKQPLPEYFRLKEASLAWKIQYSDVIRNVLRRLIPVLESPTGELLQALELHRDEEIEKERVRKEARSKRAGVDNG